jgi:curved DNA-binding protein
MAERDYYETLGVPRGATEEEIKRAYRRLAKKYHPDSNRGATGAEARFKELQEAYDVLSDREKRAQYDRFGRVGVAGQPGGTRTHTWTSRGDEIPIDFGDLGDLFEFGGRGRVGSIFEELFRRGARGATPVEPEESAGDRDVVHEITLTFEQAIRGTVVDMAPVDGTSGGRIQVKIPPGVADGQRIRVQGKGLPGRRGRRAGDLFIVCRVQEHPFFRRIGRDIYLEVPLTIAEATLGAKIEMPTLHGPTTVQIPAGTPSGRRLRLAGCGLRDSQGGPAGDQYAVIRIVPPRTLSEGQRAAVEQLARLLDENPRAGLW